MWIDLSQSLGIRSCCFQECCYPLLNLLKIIELIVEDRPTPYGIYRLFVITLINKKKIHVVTHHWEGLHFLEGQLL